MFEQLPRVTRELANAFGENEFLGRIQQVSGRDFGVSMDTLCADLDRENPYLGRVDSAPEGERRSWCCVILVASFLLPA